MFIVKLRWLWYLISLVLVIGSIFAVAIKGVNFGIDFTGGSILSVRFEERPSSVELQSTLDPLDLGSVIIQPVGDTDINIRMKTVDEDTHQAILTAIRDVFGEIDELRFDAIGPSIGAELRSKSYQAAGIAVLAILFYIAYAFRKASAHIRNWKYGIVTILAAFHDVIIPIGVFAFLGSVYGLEVGTPFVVALLTVLGYSINDTIVVMDRVRENLHRMNDSFSRIVGTSLSQTFVRSLNTSVTTLLAIIAVFLFGGDSLRTFSLTLIIGIVAGTYSSIFIASPLLVTWARLSKKRS